MSTHKFAGDDHQRLGDLNIDLSDQTKISKSKKEFSHELCDAYDLVYD